jgi:hypothetical protein
MSFDKVYFGQKWYNQQGDLIEHSGNANQEVAYRQMESITKALRGAWAFALVQTMRQEPGQPEVWENAILYPDGTRRPLRQGETVATESPRGAWLTYADAKGVDTERRIRQAPAMRFPYLDLSLVCCIQSFPSMVEFEEWLRGQTTPVFVMNASEMEMPKAPGLHAYLAISPR